MINVLFVLDALNRGGAETLVLDVCRNAANEGLDVVFAATGGGALEAEFARDAPIFYRLRRRLPFDLAIVWRLRRIIKKHQIQIIHAHQAVEGLHAYFAARGTNAKVVLTHHGFVADWKNRRALDFLIPRVAQNVFVSESLREWYAALGLETNKNFSIVYNGVDARRLQPSDKNLRGELKVDDDDLLFGMIGNFYPQPRKDQITLARALPKIFEKIPNAVCLFVGKVEAENKFAECVKSVKENNIFDRVRFLGARGDVPDILHALDAFVLSSLHEGLPIAVLEAMLIEKPCILSDIQPNLEVSNDGEFAEFFPTRNHEILADKTISLLQDSERRLTLARRAKIFADENYGIAAHLRSLRRMYEKAIDGKR